MKSMKLAAAALCILACGHPSLLGQDSKRPEQRVYAGKDLELAREKLRDHAFQDKGLEEVFRIDNNAVDVVAIDIHRRGPAIQEITVFRSGKEEKGRFVRVRTLTNPKDDDFRGLVQYLKL